MTILGILTPLILIILFVVAIILIKRAKATTSDTTTTAAAKKAGFNWVGWVVVILAALGIYGCYHSSKRQQQSQSAQQATVSRNVKAIVMVAKPNQWSKNVSIPPFHWFRIVPEGKIRIRMWNGREMDSEPGNDTWFGDEILNANFRFQSREKGDVKVIILMRPK